MSDGRPSNLHSAWARLFVHTLAASGVRRFVVSPGSRSTPITIAAMQEPGVHVDVVIDERSAGFVALGHGRASGAPAALVCTSGTAGAHYLPAIVEASEAAVPLLAITADRPWEATHTMAAQTIDQSDLFGAFVRRRLQLGPPDPGALRHVRRLAAQAVAEAMGDVPGPVHVNAAFRKPLEPVDESDPPYAAELARWLGSPPAPPLRPRPSVMPSQVEDLASRIAEADRVLVVVGPTETPCPVEGREALAETVVRLADRVGAVLSVEGASGLRGAPALRARATTSLAVAASSIARAPNDGTALVVCVGRPPTSLALDRVLGTPRVSLVTVARVGYPDPAGVADCVYRTEPGAFLDRVAAASPVEARASRAAHGAEVERLEGEARRLVARAVAADAPTEPAVFHALAEAILPEATLLVGNSLIVRDLETFGGRFPQTVLHQRGVAGIDGFFAGAVGVRGATPASEPVVVVVGDVSAVHDLGSLVLLGSVEAPLVAIVIDNGGGRIFDELPVAKVASLASIHTRAFVTPPAVPIADVAASLGIETVRPGSVAALREAVARAQRRAAATLVVVTVDPAPGRAARATLAAITSAERSQA